MAGEVPVAGALGQVLSDTFALYLKTHGYHWNVRGPDFPQLHKLLDGQYNEIWEAVDEIAEQIRALGKPVPMPFPPSRIAAGSAASDAPTMLQDLLGSHAVVLECIDVAITVAEAADDQGTLNLLADRQNAHKKQAWMLRATLGQE